MDQVFPWALWEDAHRLGLDTRATPELWTPPVPSHKVCLALLGQLPPQTDRRLGHLLPGVCLPHLLYHNSAEVLN